MKLEVHGKGIDVTEALKSHVEKACTKLKKMRFVDENDTVHVELKIYKEKVARVVFTYHAKKIGKTFVASGDNADMYAAINDTRDKVFRQLEKQKRGMSHDI